MHGAGSLIEGLSERGELFAQFNIGSVSSMLYINISLYTTDKYHEACDIVA